MAHYRRQQMSDHHPERFDALYEQLVSAWDAHQALRRSSASLARLAESASRLHEARIAMARWHRHNLHWSI